jgi:uncharacterized membrane protein YphA (DoxX/SURF4 family)
MATFTPASKIILVARILLGLIFFVFGLNFFFHFLPSPPPDPASKAGQFLGALFASGYFFVFLKIIEVIIGILLIIDIFTPLLLLLLFTISINILLFHAFLDPVTEALVISSVIFILNVYLIWAYSSLYLPLLNVSGKAKTAETAP